MNKKRSISLFEFLYKQLYVPSKSEKECLNIAAENTLNMCKCYPGFPDCDMLINISGQKYEKLECCACVVFLDSKFCNPKDFEFVFKYKNPIEFSYRNTRLIRKLLEAVNSSCSLVIVDNKLIGVIKKENLNGVAVPTIQIIGHMFWQAYLGEQPLFEYKNGEYCAIKEKFNEEKFVECWEKVFATSLKNMNSHKINKLKNGIIRTLNIISKFGIGTSIVLLNEDCYKTEVKRLTRENSGHGIRLSKGFSLFNMSKEKATEILSQITKIDGGLLVSLTGKCCSMGCIFDGEVDEKFEGDMARGSRYNSIKLYIHFKETQATEENKSESMGIVLSDDESIDFLPIFI